MLLVGLTGNIASGKSSVAQLLERRGATLIDADVLARQAVRRGTPAFDAIRERWGDEVLSPDGALDRSALRARVFGDESELEALNEQDAELLHTLIQRHQQFTDSTVAHRILSRWGDYSHRFVKVMPTEYRKVIARQHLDSDAARLASV